MPGEEWQVILGGSLHQLQWPLPSEDHLPNGNLGYLPGHLEQGEEEGRSASSLCSPAPAIGQMKGAGCIPLTTGSPFGDEKEHPAVGRAILNTRWTAIFHQKTETFSAISEYSSRSSKLAQAPGEPGQVRLPPENLPGPSHSLWADKTTPGRAMI